MSISEEIWQISRKLILQQHVLQVVKGSKESKNEWKLMFFFNSSHFLIDSRKMRTESEFLYLRVL